MTISKTQLISFIIALALIGGFIFVGLRHTTPKQDLAQEQAAWPSREVSQEHLVQNNGGTKIDATYPKTVSESITSYFKAFVDEQVQQFTDDTSWVNDPTIDRPDVPLTLTIAYDQVWSKTVHTYVFTVFSDTGGAHPLTTRKVFAFNKEGQLLSISNLFTNGMDGLGQFAKTVQAALLKRDGVQADWLKESAGPKEENYQLFVVGDDGVTVLFDPYQVAPYVYGTVDVKIPLSAFATFANPAIFSPIK